MVVRAQRAALNVVLAEPDAKAAAQASAAQAAEDENDSCASYAPPSNSWGRVWQVDGAGPSTSIINLTFTGSSNGQSRTPPRRSRAWEAAGHCVPTRSVCLPSSIFSRRRPNLHFTGLEHYHCSWRRQMEDVVADAEYKGSERRAP